MSIITKENTNSSVLQNIGISALKGAAINLGVQAVGRKLRKDNLLSTLAVGAVAGIADSFIESKISNSNGIASGAMTGLLLGGGNAIINKSSIGGTALKYAVITAVVEGVFNIAKANAFNPFQQPKYIDPNRILQTKGVRLAHSHYIILQNSSYGENGLAQRELSEGFQYQNVITALELAQKTKIVQEILSLFSDKKHGLLIMETDLTNNGRYGHAECCMHGVETTNEYNFTIKNNNSISKQPNYYFKPLLQNTTIPINI